MRDQPEAGEAGPDPESHTTLTTPARPRAGCAPAGGCLLTPHHGVLASVCTFPSDDCFPRLSLVVRILFFCFVLFIFFFVFAYTEVSVLIPCLPSKGSVDVIYENVGNV